MAGQKGNLYRPSFELYLKLKIERLSQTDIEDCILYYKWNKENRIAAEYTEILNQKISVQKANFEKGKIFFGLFFKTYFWTSKIQRLVFFHFSDFYFILFLRNDGICY
jgi:hypothetical protein